MGPSNFPNCSAFIKRLSVGYVPNKSSVNGWWNEQVYDQRLRQAVTVYQSCRVFGACRRDDF